MYAIRSYYDYENGMYYMRRKAYDPAIIYLKDVVEKYPTTTRSRDALLPLREELVEVARRGRLARLRVGDDAADELHARPLRGDLFVV